MAQGDGPGDGAKHRDASPGSGDDSGELGDIKGKARDKSKVKGKIIRVLTVMAYVLSVSLAAIMLSLYYVFLWDPKMPGGAGTGAGRLQADPPRDALFASLAAPASASASSSPPSASASAFGREGNATEDTVAVMQDLESAGL